MFARKAPEPTQGNTRRTTLSKANEAFLEAEALVQRGHFIEDADYDALVKKYGRKAAERAIQDRGFHVVDQASIDDEDAQAQHEAELEDP